MDKNKRKTIGLALGSGGSRGLAHIGIIKVLLENKIPIDLISGSSAGALVGSYLAVFGEINTLENLILKDTKSFLPMFFDFSLRGGLVSGKKIKTVFEKILKGSEFNETKIPFYVIATDLISGQAVTFSSGKIAPAVRGSMSVPVVFKPHLHKSKLLIDGGLSDPVPVDILKNEGADIVIAVNLYHQNEFRDKKFTFSRVALRSTRIVLHNLSKKSIADADIVLNPDISHYLNKFSMSDYFKPENIKKIISIGEQEAQKNLPKIKKLLGIV
jgi:NTE family protein